MDQPVFIYPQFLHRVDGSNVSWLFFAKEQDAKKAARTARREAKYWAKQGRDFGDVVPGEVTMERGMYKVCIA